MKTTLVGGPCDGQEIDVSDDIPTRIQVRVLLDTPISANPFLIPADSSPCSIFVYKAAKYKPNNKDVEIRYVFSEIYSTMVEGKKKTR